MNSASRRSQLNVVVLVAACWIPGCSRDQVADAILEVGYSKAPSINSTTVDKPCAAELDIVYRSLTRTLAELHSLHMRERASEADAHQLEKLIASIGRETGLLLQSTLTTDIEKSQAREVRLVASSIASQLTGSVDAMRRHDARAESPSWVDTHTYGEASATRFVDQYLIPEDLSPLAPCVLSLHATTFPKCSLNVDLYSLLVDRLVNGKQMDLAIRVAKDGLRRCAAQPNVAALRDALARLYKENPGAPGVPADFSAPLLDGRTYRSREQRGKIIAVTMWASWCPACRKAIPEWRRMRQRFNDETVAFVGISLDDDTVQLKKWLAPLDEDWPQVFISKRGQTRWKSPFVRQFGINSIPQTFIIDREGCIASSHLRSTMDVERALWEALAMKEQP